MSRIGVGVGLLALVLSSQPALAQRATSQSLRTEPVKQSIDVEFLSLYRQVSDLEIKLSNEPAETENKVYAEYRMINGKVDETTIMSGPPDISEKVLEAKYLEVFKLASRYGINFSPNTDSIFTWGDCLVLSRFLEGYVIFDKFSAIVAKNSWSGESRGKYHYSYEVLRVPNPDLSFRVQSYGEINDGTIPLFEAPGFTGVISKIRQLTKDSRGIWKTFNNFSDSNKIINEVPEFTGLNYDNTRALFANDQLNNIGMMLLNMMDDSPELNGLPNPKINMHRPIPRVGGNNRIILTERCFGSLELNFNDPNWAEKAEYERNLDGNITLSIAGNGTVNYFFLPSYRAVGEHRPPVYRDLKIKLK